MSGAGRWRITTENVDQVWFSGAEYVVLDPEGHEKASYGYLGLLRARWWGLVHLKGWLPLEKR